MAPAPQLNGLGIEVPTPINSQYFRDAALRLRNELGDALQPLLNADMRSQSSKTPTARRQKAIELIKFAESSAIEIDRAVQARQVYTVDRLLFAETRALIYLLDRFHNHPSKKLIQHTLRHDTELHHTLILLAGATVLYEAGNPVGIHTNEGSEKVADFWLLPSVDARVDVEVKTPLVLRSPPRPLSSQSARRVLEKALSKSSTQLRSSESGLLLVGGVGLEHSMDTLESEARKLLQVNRGRRRQLAAIHLLNLSLEVEFLTDNLFLPTTTFASIMVIHAGYSGDLIFERERSSRT